MLLESGCHNAEERAGKVSVAVCDLLPGNSDVGDHYLLRFTPQTA